MYVYQISNTLPSKHAIYIEMKYMTDFEGYSLSLNALLNVVIFSNKFLSEDKPLTCINDAIKWILLNCISDNKVSFPSTKLLRKWHVEVSKHQRPARNPFKLQLIPLKRACWFGCRVQ